MITSEKQSTPLSTNVPFSPFELQPLPQTSTWPFLTVLKRCRQSESESLVCHDAICSELDTSFWSPVLSTYLLLLLRLFLRWPAIFRTLEPLEILVDRMKGLSYEHTVSCVTTGIK